MKGEFTQKGKEAMERFKVESANEVGVNLKQGYNGDLTSREAGYVGGYMVKRLIEQAEHQMADLTARQAGSIGGMMVKKMIDAYKMQ